MRRLERLKEHARRLRTETLALWFAARDPRTPLAAKLVVAAIVAYALSPIDLIPDFIPVLGMLDELVVIPLGIALAIRLIPEPVLAECRARAKTVAASERPVSRIAAAVIVAIWAALAGLALWWVGDFVIP